MLKLLREDVMFDAGIFKSNCDVAHHYNKMNKNVRVFFGKIFGSYIQETMAADVEQFGPGYLDIDSPQYHTFIQ